MRLHKPQDIFSTLELFNPPINVRVISWTNAPGGLYLFSKISEIVLSQKEPILNYT